MATVTTDPTLHVLLVEDDRKLADLTREYLTGHGVVVTHVADGKAGLDEAARTRFDAVLLDLMLPGHRRPHRLPGAARPLRRPHPGPHRARRGGRPGHGAGDGGRRLPRQALLAARAPGPAPGGDPPGQGAGRAAHRHAPGRGAHGRPGRPARRARRARAGAHRLRVRHPARPGGAGRPDPLPRAAHGAGQGERRGGLRPLHRRPRLPAARRSWATTRSGRGSSRRCAAPATCWPGRASEAPPGCPTPAGARRGRILLAHLRPRAPPARAGGAGAGGGRPAPGAGPARRRRRSGSPPTWPPGWPSWPGSRSELAAEVGRVHDAIGLNLSVYGADRRLLATTCSRRSARRRDRPPQPRLAHPDQRERLHPGHARCRAARA